MVDRLHAPGIWNLGPSKAVYKLLAIPPWKKGWHPSLAIRFASVPLRNFIWLVFLAWKAQRSENFPPIMKLKYTETVVNEKRPDVVFEWVKGDLESNFCSSSFCMFH